MKQKRQELNFEVYFLQIFDYTPATVLLDFSIEWRV